MHRLYFIPNEYIIKMLNNRSYLIEVLKSIFNIFDVLIQNTNNTSNNSDTHNKSYECIVGIVSSNERVLFKEGLDILQPITIVIDEFERRLKETLKEHLESRI